LEQFQNGLTQKPTDLGAHYYLAEALAALGRTRDAVRAYEDALTINDIYVEARYGLALALIRSGEFQRAGRELARIVADHPEFAEAHCRLGELALKRGEYVEAIARYRKAIDVRPDLPEPRNNLAWLLATCPTAALRNGPEALAILKPLVDEDTELREAPTLWDTLAAAYAEAGQFDRATEAAKKAVDLTTRAGNERLAEKVRRRLALYAASQPYRERSP
jgi:predicted Zn-dependent protease